MNITILANKDVASCLALNYLIQDLSEHRLSVFLSSRVGSRELAPPLKLLKMVEQDLYNEVLFPLLREGEENTGQLLGFLQLQSLLGGRLSELNTINSESGLQTFAESEPELVLSVRYGVILKEQALSIPTFGVLNLHSGKLPQYKGVMATFWALLNSESELGTTLHTIDDSSIDTGRIIATSELPVEKDKSYLWHVLELYKEGCANMAAAANNIARGDIPTATSQVGEGNYFSFPQESDLKAFAAKGLRLFDPEDVINLSKCFLPST